MKYVYNQTTISFCSAEGEFAPRIQRIGATDWLRLHENSIDIAMTSLQFAKLYEIMKAYIDHDFVVNNEDTSVKPPPLIVESESGEPEWEL